MADEAQESILNVSSVFLFGKVLSDLQISKLPADNKHRGRRKGANTFLLKQIDETGAAKKAQLARIYAFAFEGVLCDLMRPAVFLVHGDGEDPSEEAVAADERSARQPGWSGRTGVGVLPAHFSKDMRVWVYDKNDFTMRLDVDTGDFTDLLIGPEIAMRDPMAASSGMLARQSGMLARQSGMLARQSGMLARSAGMLARSSGMLARGGGSD